MKYYLIIGLLSFVLLQNAIGQTIPFGESNDTIIHDDGKTVPLVYYKPANYDNNNGNMLIYIHGIGGNGYAYQDLQAIADRQKVMVVAPSFPSTGSGFPATGYTLVDTIHTSASHWYKKVWWGSYLFKKIYRHVLARENRDTIWTYFTGFSAGGQTVNRQMLLRQAIPDSIPIKMAVSCSPLLYTWPVDTIFDNSPMYCSSWPAGLGEPYAPFWTAYDINQNYNIVTEVHFMCENLIKQFYGENYGVICGSMDTDPGTGNGGGPGCASVSNWGTSRFDKSKKFFQFCQGDALIKNVPFYWKYDSIIGAQHNQYDVFNTKLFPTDTISVFENILFNTPYHAKVYSPPSSDFRYLAKRSDCKEVEFYSDCVMGAYTTTVLWDFGDGQTSTQYNPIHNFTNYGYFNITLSTSTSIGTSSITKQIYITDTVMGSLTFCGTIDNNTFSANYNLDSTQITINVNDTITAGVASVFIKDKYGTSYPYSIDTADFNYVWSFGSAGYVNTTINFIGNIWIGQPKVTIFTQPGVYDFSVQAIDSVTGCKGNLLYKPNFFKVVDPLGISNFKKESGSLIRIIPNPNNGVFTITKHNSLKTSISITNVLGEVIYSNQFGNTYNEIDLSNQSKGIYFISIKGEGMSETKKVIIE